MKGNSLIWVLGRTRKRIPALLVITLTQMCSALLGVFFALGTRGVIDGAISGDPGQFWRACGVQAALILGLLISLTLNRHFKEHTTAEVTKAVISNSS